MTNAQDNCSSNRLASVEAPYPGQVVLVLQGGGALGSYQAGVYQALQCVRLGQCRRKLLRRTGVHDGIDVSNLRVGVSVHAVLAFALAV